MSDTNIGPGGPAPTLQEYSPVAAVGFATAGIPVSINGTGEAVLANATAPGTNAQCIGLAAAPAEPGERVPVKTGGIFTSNQVSSFLDTGTALTPGAAYYVSTTAGKITKTAPSGSNFLTFIGIAISAESLLVLPALGFEASSP